MHADRRHTVGLERGDGTLSVDVRSGEAGHPTVLLLHGLAGYGGEWAGVRHFLPEEFGVIMPDQRGHGASFDGTTDLDVSAQCWVDDAVACVEACADGPVTIVGQSMGSLVATRVAGARPDLVDTLVLIEGGMAAMSDDDLVGLAAWFDSWPAAFSTRREATEFFGVDERSTKAWVDGLASTDAGFEPRFDAATMVATMQELAGTDSWELWKRITTPTVIMQASSSVISADDIDQMISLRPATELVTIAGGHDLHLDEPEIVAQIIARVCSR